MSLDLEHVTDVAAVCAVASPWWLHSLSSDVQFILPFLGALWLIIQMSFKLAPLFKRALNFIRRKNP